MIITNSPGGGSGGIPEISTNSGMTSYCTESNKNKFCEFTGTTGLYENGCLYRVKEGPTTKSFASCSWTEIAEQCNAGYVEDLISDGVWNIGDINTTVNYGGQTGGIQLVHCLTDTQRGSSYYNTDGHIVCQFVNTIATSKYMSSDQAQKYFEGTLHTACNTTIYGGLDSTLKSALKSWTCRVGIENTSTTHVTGIYSQEVYLAVPACKEVGSDNTYNGSENQETFVFDYYNDSSTAQTRRVKSGAYAYWWLRSPSYRTSGGNHLAYVVRNDGSIDSFNVSIALGVSPIMVI